MRQVASHGTVSPFLARLLLPLVSMSFSPLSYLPYRSFCSAISRPHATLVTNLNCSTSKVNVLILPVGHWERRRCARRTLSSTSTLRPQFRYESSASFSRTSFALPGYFGFSSEFRVSSSRFRILQFARR